ncbi:RB1-inducible coiled-coil protein 1-like, partial [Homarus americanus]
MIYVFLVDTGTMMTFDMNLALENVSVLKEVINRAMKVPPEKQVLLISGGEALDPNQRVCQYSAGTDTNPIFLFSKTTIEGQTPPSPSIDYGTDTDLKDQVEGALNMPASYNTVVARAQLAQQFHEHSRDQTRTCQQLVHDQHLQQQGWAAVVANLEDIVSAFKNRFENFESKDLKLLSRIPVLPALLGERKRKNESQHGGKVDETENNAEEDKDGIEGCEAKPTMSLLDWISAKDSQSNVGQIAQLCYRGLTQINEGMLTQLASEVNSVSHEADRPQMKEIKGLGERLFGLEQLMHEANKIVQEQNNFAQALIQNQNRAGKVNDPSIFPDLCTSHRKNLMHMLKNHQRVQDIKRRCIKAKEELSENLHVRLKWIMYIEKKLYELDNKLTMHHENVRRVTGLLQVIEQIHRAPRVYVSAITEVARRHTFSKSFVQFSSHFLASLFPGMDDLPPDFATQPPDTFDDTLPNLASMLVVGEVISIPPLLQVALQSHTSNTHSPREHHESETDTEEFEKVGCSGGSDGTFSPMEVAGVLLPFNRPGTVATRGNVASPASPQDPAISPESMLTSQEFVTAEYYIDESMPSSYTESGGTAASCSRHPPPMVKTHHVITAELQQQLEDKNSAILNLQTDLTQAKEEVDQLQQRLSALASLQCQDEVLSLKSELASLRGKVRDEGETYVNYISELSSRILDVLLQVEAVKRLTLEHELEMVNLKERWQEDDSSRQEEIIVLTQKLKSLEETLQCAERERSDLENNFKERFAAHIQEEKDKIVKILEVSFSEREKNALESLREQLINEHQAHVSRLLKEKEEAIQAACEEVRTKLVVEWREVVDQQHKDLTEKHAAHYAQCKHQWEQEKRTEIADKETRWRDERDSNVEHVRQQYKMELEGLRSRFRMMTTASMDKSPSETSLEKFERGDFLDMGAHEAALARLREELLKEKEVAIEETKIGLQEQFGQVRRDELQKHETMRKDERRRIEAEKQIVFNDAIKSVSQDKERVIEDLRLRVELLTDETEKLRRLMHNAATGSTDHLMSALVSENEALKSGASAVSPSGSLSANEDVRKLQQENQELRDKLVETPHKMYCTAEVVSKEFCQAKKFSLWSPAVLLRPPVGVGSHKSPLDHYWTLRTIEG